MGSWNGVVQSPSAPDRRRTSDSPQRVRLAWGDEAGRAAFDIVLIERLNTTHPDTDPSSCAWCGKSGTPDGTLLPRPPCMAAPDCRAPWREGSLKAAIETLGS